MVRFSGLFGRVHIRAIGDAAGTRDQNSVGELVIRRTDPKRPGQQDIVQLPSLERDGLVADTLEPPSPRPPHQMIHAYPALRPAGHHAARGPYRVAIYP